MRPTDVGERPTLGTTIQRLTFRTGDTTLAIPEGEKRYHPRRGNILGIGRGRFQCDRCNSVWKPVPLRGGKFKRGSWTCPTCGANSQGDVSPSKRTVRAVHVQEGPPSDYLWLDPIPDVLRGRAREAFQDGNALSFLGFAGNHHGIDLVFRNEGPLRARGLYEVALLDAYMMHRGNHHQTPDVRLRDLFARADRDRLRAAGDPLPGPGPFTLFRGVAGQRSARRVTGISWTGSVERACCFATRYDLPDPAIVTVTVSEVDVLAYNNERDEDEFLLLLPPTAKPRRLEQVEFDRLSAEALAYARSPEGLAQTREPLEAVDLVRRYRAGQLSAEALVMRAQSFGTATRKFVEGHIAEAAALPSSALC